MNCEQSVHTDCKAISVDSNDASPLRRTHLIGIGGAGMAALATCLADLGHEVSGSDLRSTATTRKLVARGIKLSPHHAPNNVVGADLVVVSDAVPSGNLELKEANIRAIPIVRRADMLDRICRTKFAVMISGSHGKSSITAMLATVLDTAGVEPSFALGADVPALGGSRARIGRGEHFVVEACEAFKNLAGYHPGLAVISNIDREHSDHYGGQERLDAAFVDFANRAQWGAVVNGDDPGVRRIFSRLVNPVSFGFDPSNRFSAAQVRLDAESAVFDVLREGSRMGCISLAVGGRHMVMNALACVAAASSLGIGFDAITDGLRRYAGIHRRWQTHDTGSGPRLIDDFAHHPTELKALVEVARATARTGQRLVIAFQPQLYSRTRALLSDFANVLAMFDVACVLDIDGAGETDPGDISSADLVDAIRKQGGEAMGIGSASTLARRISRLLKPDNILITAGAGSISEVIEDVALALQRMHSPVESSDFSLAPRRAVEELPRVTDRVHSTTTDTVLDLFDRQVRSQPQAAAVSAGTQVLTYGQLDQRAEELARRLLSEGLKIQDVVGVHAPSSTELIVIVLALAKAGGVYLPLDMGLPAERLAFMLSDAQARFLLTASDRPLVGLNIKILHFDDLFEADAEQSSLDAPVAIAGTHTAYLCYTSGSTGRPKGVAIRHACLANFAAAALGRFAVGPDARMALNTSIGFDVSLGEIWMTLCAGGQLCATGEAKPLIGDALRDFLDRNAITHTAITPTVLSTLPAAHIPSLRCVIAAGEACPPALVERWAPGRKFFNAYGPTEATIYATAGECRAGEAVTIGTPLTHVAIRILDDRLLEVSDGAVGELCIGGAGIADGYLSLPAETVSRFIEWREPSGEMQRLYRTGDLVNRSADGTLFYAGRLDSQVKVLGNRVELEEIEQTLLSRFSALLDVAVALNVGSGGNGHLVCFAVVREDEFDWDSARGDLERWLPSHMIPAEFVVVERMKTTPSGKKDRAGLMSANAHGRIRRIEYHGPHNDVEAKIAVIWKSVLGLETDVGVDEHFSWLGGDSLTAMQIIMEIEKTFGVTTSPGHFGAISTVGKMAIQVADLLWAAAPSAPQETQGFRSTRAYKELRNITANWPGTRVYPDSVIVSAGGEAPTYQFFLCVQNESEMHGFAAALGNDFRVHGMRSGHLVMEYNPESLNALCAHYVEEIERAHLKGKFLVGGICQGTSIAIRLSEMLRERHHSVDLVILIEQSKIVPVDGEVAFYYSEDSFINPFRRFASARARFNEVYGQNYTLDILPGAHGTIHRAPQAQILAHKLRARLGSVGDSISAEASLTCEDAEDVKLVEASWFFDSAFYAAQLQDASRRVGSMAAHYARRGWLEGLDPGPHFSTRSYLERYPDVRNAQVNPLVHYLRFGMGEGRSAWSDEEIARWQTASSDHPEGAIAKLQQQLRFVPQLRKGDRVAIHAHSRGHFVFRQLQSMLGEAFNQIGIECALETELADLAGPPPVVRIVIAPHDFFHLNPLPDSRHFADAVLFNSEQMSSVWFNRALPLLMNAPLVLDMNFPTASCLAELGAKAVFLPFGIVPGNEIFRLQPDLSAEAAVRGLPDDMKSPITALSDPLSQRGIDVLFVGSNSDRRTQYFAEHSAFFAANRCFIRLVDVIGPLEETNPRGIPPRALAGLAQRSKILMNIHHFDAPYFEWQRLVHYGFAQQCCVVTERCNRIPGLVPGVHYLEGDKHALPALMDWLLHDPDGKDQAERVRRAGYETAMDSLRLDRTLQQLFRIDETASMIVLGAR
jgi:UDP-N-acetylmuramate--L-alanine ligase